MNQRSTRLSPIPSHSIRWANPRRIGRKTLLGRVLHFQAQFGALRDPSSNFAYEILKAAGRTPRCDSRPEAALLSYRSFRWQVIYATIDKTGPVLRTGKMNDDNPAPRHYLGVMISSTFTDLKEHRAALIDAINGQELKHVAMETSSAKLVDVIESSLQMVHDASAYIGVISRKYGQTPLNPKRNPREVSITELEFDEAQKANRPILLFIMGPKHPLREEDVELDPDKRKKLNEFDNIGRSRRNRELSTLPEMVDYIAYDAAGKELVRLDKNMEPHTELRRFLNRIIKQTGKEIADE